MKDRNGDVINIDLSNVQLVTGAILPFFSLPYSRYAKWIKWDWIVSIWKYTSHLQIVVDIENMWTPLLVRDHDISLMDSAILYNFSPQYLHEINQAWIFLQVITLADITSAAYTHILQEALSGEAIVDRYSTLRWPCEEQPAAPAWWKWISLVQYFHNNGVLFSPLGSWRQPTHQHWLWYTVPDSDLVYYHNVDEDCWACYSPSNLKQQIVVPCG